jgi:hypothetical protein
MEVDTILAPGVPVGYEGKLPPVQWMERMGDPEGFWWMVAIRCS